jgi:hypothetical protein
VPVRTPTSCLGDVTQTFRASPVGAVRFYPRPAPLHQGCHRADDEEEHNRRHDDEGDDVLDQDAVVENPMTDREMEVRERFVGRPRDGQDRQDQVDDVLDDDAKEHGDNHRNRQVDHVALQDEVLELRTDSSSRSSGTTSSFGL